MRASHLRVEPAGEPDEATLVKQARAGDRSALDALIGRYMADVYDVAYRILGEREAAEDAAQDAFVNALRGLDRFRGDSSFRTWLLRITMNAARSAGRRKGRRREIALVPGVDVVADTPSASDAVAQKSEAERAEAALQQLPEKQRLAITLRTYQGLSYAEIAELTGSTEGAARVNYHLGIKRLRELLK